MSSLWPWVRSDWRGRWPGLLALAVLIALAGGVTTALASGARRADSAFGRFEHATSAPNLTANVDLATIEQLGDDHVESVDDLAAIDGMQGVLAESWWAIALYPELDPPGVVNAFAIAKFASGGTIDEGILLAGDLDDTADPDSVVINEEAAATRDLAVGDTIMLRTASPARLAEWAGNDAQFGSMEALDGPVVEVRVVAVVRSVTDLASDRFPLITFTEGFARAHRDDIAHVVPAFALRADPARLDEVAAAADATLAPYGIDVFVAEDLGATVRPSIRVEVTTIWVATAIAAAAGLLLVAQAIGRHLAATSADHPTRRAMGMTRGQLALGGALGVLPAAIVGAALVPLIAWALSWLFPRGVARLAEPDPGWRFDVSTLAIGAGGTVIAVVLATLAMAAVGARSRPSALGGRSRLAGWVLARPAAALGASFARDPAGTGGRSRAVALVTGAGIAIGVGGVVAVGAMDTSRQHLLTTPRLFGAPAPLVFESNGTFGIAELVDATLATPGVTALTRHIAINDDTTAATGPGGSSAVAPEAYVSERGEALPPIVEGDYPQRPDEVALGAATAADLGAGVDDVVTVAPVDGGQPIELRVTGRVVAWGNESTRRAFIVEPATLDQIICPDVGTEECDVSANLFAAVDDAGAQRELTDLGFRAVSTPATVDRVREVGAIPWYLAGFLCLLGGAGLAHGLFTATRRRRRDLAIVRALGLPANRAAAALTWQAVTTAVLGALAGVVLGAVIGPWLWRVIADDLGVIADGRLPATAIIFGAIGAVAVAIALSVLPRRRAAHQSVAEGLHAE